MENTPIHRLRDDLVREFARDVRGPETARILGAYAQSHEDWRNFVMFDADVYTRNLVARNAHFEMLILCWSGGQTSPIHNHAGQNCWMAVLDGEIEEAQFEIESDKEPARLVQTQTKTFSSGRVAFINDDIALHRVRPLAGKVGISLHVYSRPIDVCNVYDEHSGQVLQKQLKYHSIHGTRVRVAPESRS